MEEKDGGRPSPARIHRYTVRKLAKGGSARLRRYWKRLMKRHARRFLNKNLHF